MWRTGNNNIKAVQDIYKKMMDLEGELTDEQAGATLCEFLYNNPAYMMDLIGNIKMFPMQEVIIKGWMKNDYNMGVWGRGVSKSWSVAMFSLIWGIFNPKCRIVIVSFAFRAARRILEQCEKFVNDEGAVLLKACFDKDMNRKTDEWIWMMPNGTTIQCLPLGDGTKIRGTRADVLIVDEFAYLPETIIGEVLRPFLTANNKIREQIVNKEREDKAIAQGLMTDADRTTIEDRKKVIFLSSACYQFEHMYKRFKEWVDIIENPKRKEELKESGVSYFVSHLSYEAAPLGLLNLKEIDEAKKDISEAMFDREYRAFFTGDSDGYYRAAKMRNCSVKDGDTPCLELVGEKGARYVMGIDQSSSGSEGSDHFAMCVMKIVRRPSDNREIGMLVHSYAIAGGNLKDHMLYFYWLLTHFNIVYIALDSSQGDELEFVNACNQSKLFKDARINLSSIEAEFKKDTFTELPLQIKRSYNLTIGRILQKQPFSSAFQMRANEYLQGCFDHRGVLFAGKIGANSSVAGTAMNVDISMLGSHEDFQEKGIPMSISQFIENQDRLLDLTRKELSMIQQKKSELGTMSFVLPQNARRTSGPKKERKDSYSAFVLCNWAVHLYVDAMNMEVQTGPIDFPYAFVG